jgi:hypothetical protein
MPLIVASLELILLELRAQRCLKELLSWIPLPLWIPLWIPQLLWILLIRLLVPMAPVP